MATSHKRVLLRIEMKNLEHSLTCYDLAKKMYYILSC